MATASNVFLITLRDGLQEKKVGMAKTREGAAKWAQRQADAHGNVYWVRDRSQELFKGGKKIPRVVYVAVPDRRW